jgi:hypothetical protein
MFSSPFLYNLPLELRTKFQTGILQKQKLDIFVGWLWWGDTGVSELRPLRAYFSSPYDCNVDHGTMVSTGANS